MNTLQAKATSNGRVTWTAEGTSVDALMRRADQEAPGAWSVNIRSDRTSDGTVWGIGGGRLLATREGSAGWFRY